MNNTLIHSSTAYDPLELRLVATIIFGFLALIGITGNILVFTVVLRVKGMLTPTNCYLISLASSDFLFFLTTAPVELSYRHLPKDVYLFGAAGCAVLTSLSYLTINVSSLSITAFTVERYIGICHPMRAKYMCTVRRAIVIICSLWMFSLAYNSSWIYLATTVPSSKYHDMPDAEVCTFRISRSSVEYKTVYLVDFLGFYVIPLILCCLLYGRISYVLMKSETETVVQSASVPLTTINNCHMTTINNCHVRTIDNGHVTIGQNEGANRNGSSAGLNEATEAPLFKADSEFSLCSAGRPRRTKFLNGSRISKGRTQVVKMLVVIVCVFAVCWLPYRSLVLYNSFASRPWVDIWYVTFAKTLIFLNCGINPILYNLMSAKFRSGFSQLYAQCCGLQSRYTTVELRTTVAYSPSARIHQSTLRRQHVYSSRATVGHLNQSPSQARGYLAQRRLQKAYSNNVLPVTKRASKKDERL